MQGCCTAHCLAHTCLPGLLCLQLARLELLRQAFAFACRCRRHRGDLCQLVEGWLRVTPEPRDPTSRNEEMAICVASFIVFCLTSAASRHMSEGATSVSRICGHEHGQEPL
jgi:hypothetical protein